MKNLLFACLAAVSVAAAGCVGFEHSTSVTTPTSTTSPTGMQALTGTWQSVQDAGSGIIPNPNTCTNFVWTSASQTATTAAGSFSATCNGVAFSGTANGTLTSATTATWGANGTASGTGLPQSPCPITLTGTAQLAGNTITVPYSGSTCVGAVSGTQTLNRK